MILGVTDDETLARLREMDIALQAPEMVVELDEAEAMMQANLRSPAAARPAPAEAGWSARPAMA